MIKIIFTISFSINFIYAETPKLYINELLASNASFNVDDDFSSFCDWIEIYNSEDTIVNIGGFYITDDLFNLTKYQISPNYTIQPDSFIIIWADGRNLMPGDSVHGDGPSNTAIYINSLHTNFKLKKSSEEIGLSNQDGLLVDSIFYQSQLTDVSFGRKPDGSNEFYYFADPTPQVSNVSLGFQDTIKSGDPHFSIYGGIYNNQLTVSISAEDSFSNIYYTTDGSKPNIFSHQYVSPIEINFNTVLKSRIIDSTKLSSNVITNTYLIGQNFNLPVISISVDSAFLWDDDIGIYVEGDSNNVYDWNCYQNWERPAHIEFFDHEGVLRINMDVGLKLHGASSRVIPQKSFAIFSRNKYGSDYIDYQIFKDKEIFEYKSFILRNSGYDWRKTLLRDGLSHTIITKKLDIDYQAYQPSAIYLNGSYWGILNIREKINEHYIQSNHNIDPYNLELIDIAGAIRAVIGDTITYTNLLSFVENEDMDIDENYSYIKSLIDINRYIDYQITQIFYANHDWPGNNVKIWRSTHNIGKYKWILNDLDFAFNSVDWMYSTSHNAINWATTENSIHNQYNPPWSTSLFRNLLNNQSFKNEFIQRSAILMNTLFNDQNILDIMDSLKSKIEFEISRHIDRWSNETDFWGNNISISSMDDWYDEISIINEFANNRSNYFKQHIIDFFGIDTLAELVININDTDAGAVNIHGINIESFPDTGSYFKNIPIRIKSEPNDGYQFVNWVSNSGFISDSDSITILISGDTAISAVFELIEPSTILINEINYSSNSDLSAGDWIELYNQTDAAINIVNWSIKTTQGDLFIINDSISIDGNDYIILCQDTLTFKSTFPGVNNYIGNINFRFDSSGDSIQIFNDSGHIVNSLAYDGEYPWPEILMNSGSSLELKNYNFDNRLGESWRASHTIGGSPGVHNNSIIMANLFINEFLASNNSVLSDDNGEFDDWVEFYNGSNQTINLAGLYVTDDLNNPYLWKIPNTNSSQTIINPKSFIIFWADEDTNHSERHFDFKMNKNGEQLGVYLSDSEQVFCVDSISYGMQEEDISYGRINDGDNSWELFNEPTPGLSNAVLELEAIQSHPDKFYLYQNYPNPFNPFTTIKYSTKSNGIVKIDIYDIRGRLICNLVNQYQESGLKSHRWDARDDFGRSLSAGVYFLQLKSGNLIQTKKMLLIK